MRSAVRTGLRLIPSSSASFASVKGMPGGYVVEQTTYFGRTFSERVYVRISAKESDIFYQDDILTDPYGQRETGDTYQMFAVYIAAALVAILFAEWLLQLRDNA